MAISNGLDESESDAQRDHSRAVRLLRGTRYKCATGWRLLERILFLLCGKSRWLLYHRRFLWQVVMAALGSRGAQFIPSLEGRGFLWQFCKAHGVKPFSRRRDRPAAPNSLPPGHLPPLPSSKIKFGKFLNSHKRT